jgi:hypothetical protein
MASLPRPQMLTSSHFEFDSVNRILLRRLQGRITEEALESLHLEGHKYRTATKPRAEIVDCSCVTETTISSDRIRQLARQQPAEPDITLVIVSPATAAFGLGRMFQIVGESTRPSLTLVRTVDEALAALGVQSPHFEPLA